MTKHLKVTDEIASLILANVANPIEEALDNYKPGRIGGRGSSGGMIRKLKSGEQGKRTEASPGRTAQGEADPDRPGRSQGSVGNRTSLADKLKNPATKKAIRNMKDKQKAMKTEDNSPLRQKAIKLLGKKKGNAKADHYKSVAAKLRSKGQGLGKNDSGTPEGAADAKRDTYRRDAPGDTK